MASKTLRLTILLASSLLPVACSAEERTSNPSSPPEEKTASASIMAAERGPEQLEGTMHIRIRAGGRTFTARLEDSAAARDFAAQLPIDLTLKDYASTEKIANLPRQLSTQGAPPGVDPAAGDIAYYAPWGNLAIYYRAFGYSRGLVRLGRIDAGAEALGSFEGRVTIESIENKRR